LQTIELVKLEYKIMVNQVAATNENSTQSTCKVAIVGAGYMAREHIRAFQDVRGVEITGIHSRTRSRAEALAQEFHVPNVCDSIAELYTKSAADLVVVSVPELSVNEVSCACFNHPWAALIEKPAGYDVADAEEIARMAGKTGSRAFVALNRRHYSSTRSMLEDLATNPEPRFICVQDQEDAIAALKAGQPKLVVENWMYANSIHMIDYFMMLGRGRVTEVEPFVRWYPDKPGFVAAKIMFDSGDVGLYQAVWNAPGPWGVTVTTYSKRWELLRPVEQAAYQTYGSRKLEPVIQHEWDRQFKPGLRRQAELAVRAAMGEATPELPTLEDALVSMRLVQAIYKVK
jgi:predicted dehydrogenase